jgi:hypothetical protein
MHLMTQPTKAKVSRNKNNFGMAVSQVGAGGAYKAPLSYPTREFFRPLMDIFKPVSHSTVTEGKVTGKQIAAP